MEGQAGRQLVRHCSIILLTETGRLKLVELFSYYHRSFIGQYKNSPSGLLTGGRLSECYVPKAKLPLSTGFSVFES
jgi:hypothetical protein